MIDWDGYGWYEFDAILGVEQIEALIRAENASFHYNSTGRTLVEFCVLRPQTIKDCAIVDVNVYREDPFSKLFGLTGFFNGSYADRTRTDVKARQVLPGAEFAIKYLRGDGVANIPGPVGIVTQGEIPF